MKRNRIISDYIGAFCLVFALFYVFFGETALKEYLPASEKVGISGKKLILDPGHGGEDGGAVSVTGKKESEINLEIGLRCEELAAFFGIETVMTRDSELIEYPAELSTTHSRKVWDQKSRVSLINSTENAVLVSIHQNKYTSAGPSGAQAFYNPAGKELAGEIQAGFLSWINTDNKRQAKPVSEDIYLMNSIKCPAVLAECGFLSNPEEAQNLELSSYQKRLSAIIIGSFVNIYG